jgi:hypothetical protein
VVKASGPLLRPDPSRPFANAVLATLAGQDRRDDARRALQDAERSIGVELVAAPGHRLPRGRHRPLGAADLTPKALAAAAVDVDRWNTRFRLDPDAEAELGPTAAARLITAAWLVLEGRCLAAEFVLRLSGSGDVWVLGHREWGSAVAHWANRDHPRNLPWTYADFRCATPSSPTTPVGRRRCSTSSPDAERVGSLGPRRSPGW